MSKATPLKCKAYLAEKWTKRKEKLSATPSLEEKLDILDDYAFTFSIVYDYAASISESEEELNFVKMIADQNKEDIDRVTKEIEALNKEREIEESLFS